MSLIACPECGRPVSSQAPQCPTCGFPLRAAATPKSNRALAWGLGCLLAAFASFFVIAIIGLLAAIAIPSFVHARDASQTKTCLRHLEEIADLKAQWAEEHNADDGAVLTEDEQDQLLRGRIGKLSCPKDSQHTFRTSYVLNPIGEDPVCLCDEKHSLAAADEEDDEE